MSTLTSIEQYQKLISGLKSCSESEKLGIVRRLARTDLFFLLWFVLGRKDIARQWLFDRCREVQSDPNGCLDLWAREHYKSTIITYGLSIQDILSSHGDDPDRRWGGIEVTLGIFSHTRPTAKAFLRQIKREFEANELLKAAFPDVLWQHPHKEAPKWSEDEGIIVKRKSNPKEATIEAWGLVDGQPTSKHFFVRVYDDVVTRESVTTAEMIKKTTEAWELSINLGTDGGIERYIGTRYSDGDTYRVLMERNVVKPRIYPATHDGTPTGDPVLLSHESLADKRDKMGPHTFSCQMLQNPVPADNAFFKEEWFSFYDLDDLPPVNKYGASDYAVTDGDGDYTELGIDGVSEDDTLYLAIDSWHGQTSSDVWIEKQLDQIARHKPLAYFNEAGVIRRAVEPFLTRRMRERKVYCRIEWIPSIADKPTRARSLQARCAMGKVKLPRNDYGKRLLDQLLRFPVGAYDDAVDRAALMALVIDQAHPAIVRKPPPKKYVDRWDKVFNEGREISNWKVV